MAVSKSYRNLHIVESGTSNGWTYEKYSDGTMRAERDVTTGSSWSTVQSPVAHNTTNLTLPAGMTVKSGYATLLSKSTYIVAQNIQVATDSVALESFRLATSSASVKCRVVLEGTF